MQNFEGCHTFAGLLSGMVPPDKTICNVLNSHVVSNWFFTPKQIILFSHCLPLFFLFLTFFLPRSAPLFMYITIFRILMGNTCYVWSQHKFSTMALAFKTDRFTLTKRVDIHKHQRDLAEASVETEIDLLQKAFSVKFSLGVVAMNMILVNTHF